MISDPHDPEMYKVKVDIQNVVDITQIVPKDSYVTYNWQHEKDASAVKARASTRQKQVPTQGFM